MTQYLELELLIIFAAAIIAIGTFIVLKDRTSSRKEQAANLNIQKAPMRNARRTSSTAARERVARQRMARQRVARSRA